MTKRHLFIIPAILLILMCGAQTGFAHAKLLASVPKAGESLAVPPTAITLTFTTRIQHEMSSVELIGSDGSSLLLTQREVSPDGKTLSAELPELARASYTVKWRVLSADDHLINGDFSFQINAAGLQQAGEVARSRTDHSAMDHGDQHDNSVSWQQSIIRWVIYIALMVLGGGLVFRIYVLAGAGAPEAVDRFRSMNAMLLGAAAVLAIFLIVSLLQQTNVIFSAVYLRNVYSVISETNFGFAWMVQFGASVAVLLLIVVQWAKNRSNTKLLIGSALAVWLLIPLGISLSGHAKAANHEFSFAIVMDWLHMVAAAAWTGGIASIAIFLPGVNRPAGLAGLEQPAVVVHRFHRLAIVATVTLVASGVYNSWIHVESLAALLNTLYGQVLLAKIAITFLMLLLGAMNAFVLAPRISTANAEAGRNTNERLFLRSVRIEAALALAVLLLAAVLVFLPPAREHLPIVADSGAESMTTE